MDKTEEGLQTFVSIGSTIGLEKEDLGGWVHADTYLIILKIYEQLEKHIPILNEFVSTFRTNIPLKKISTSYKENKFFVKIKHKEIGLSFDFKEIINDVKYWGLIEKAIKKIIIDRLIELVFIHKDEIIKKSQAKQEKPNWTRLPNVELDGVNKLTTRGKKNYFPANTYIAGEYAPPIDQIKEISIINDSPHYFKFRRLITRIMDDKRNKRSTCDVKVEADKDIQITISRKEFFEKLDCAKTDEQRLLKYFFTNTHALDIATADNNFLVETFYKRRIVTVNDERLNNLKDIQSIKKIVSISFCVDYNIYNAIISKEKGENHFGYGHIIDNPDKVLECFLKSDKNKKKIQSYSEQIKKELDINNNKASIKGYTNAMAKMLELIYYKTNRVPKSQVLDMELPLVELATKIYKSYRKKDGGVYTPSLLKYFALLNLYIIQLAHQDKRLDYFEEVIAINHTQESVLVKVKTHTKAKKIELEKTLFG